MSEIAVAITINGQLLHQNSNGLWVNSEGDSGYHTHFTISVGLLLLWTSM